MKILFTFLFLTSSLSVFAQQELEPQNQQRSPAQIKEDRLISERAKAKAYKGGAEEGELRVQAQLPKAQRKIAPVIDKTEVQDHD